MDEKKKGTVGEIKLLLGKSGVFDSSFETAVITVGPFDENAKERIRKEFGPIIIEFQKEYSFRNNNDFWFIVEAANKFQSERNIVVVSDNTDFLKFVVETPNELLNTDAGFATGVTYNFTDGPEEYKNRTGIYQHLPKETIKEGVDGLAKKLDFGLLKIVESDRSGSFLSDEFKVLFSGDDEVYKFFIHQIKVKKLTQFHISTSYGLSDDQKREVIEEVARSWQQGRKKINKL